MEDDLRVVRCSVDGKTGPERAGQSLLETDLISHANDAANIVAGLQIDFGIHFDARAQLAENGFTLSRVIGFETQ